MEQLALPVMEYIPKIQKILRDSRRLVLQAEPGAGKTTAVPPALLGEVWLSGKKIIVLEPRRVAARAAACRVADLHSERPGGVVGYRVRGESRAGADTRIEYVTEGVFLSMLRRDPALEDVGLVIFDEFHERSLQSDLSLALTLQTAELLRPDLRLAVMSATLDSASVAAMIGAESLSCPGRLFPVSVQYRPSRHRENPERDAASCVRTALAEQDGDVLVFLPGIAMIRRVERLLQQGTADAVVLVLHGNLPLDRQRGVLAPLPGQRRVILSTSIAETSLTIQGVGAVVDSGLTRVSLFDPGSGMSRLQTVRISEASARQRAGRAGRTASGVCYRLWSEQEFRSFSPFATPAILQEDLAGFMLELACHGISDLLDLQWVDPPEGAAVSSAMDLLGRLGALDDSGRVTERGRRMAELPLHPRLSHMLSEAGRQLTTACWLAALLSEGPLFRFQEGEEVADIRLRLKLCGSGKEQGLFSGYPVNWARVRRVRESARDLMRRTGAEYGNPDGGDAARQLLRAYPDRIGGVIAGQKGRFRLSGGGMAFCRDTDPLSEEAFLIAARTGGVRGHSLIFEGTGVSPEELKNEFAGRIREDCRVSIQKESGRIVQVQNRLLGSLVLESIPVRDMDDGVVAAAVCGYIRETGMEVFRIRGKAALLRARILFMHKTDPEHWPDLSDIALLNGLEEWLTPFLSGIRSITALGDLDFNSIFSVVLDYPQRRMLQEQVPESFRIPDGRCVPIDYTGEKPCISIFVQQAFGIREHPRICGNRVPLLIELLSPARRPVQLTADLPGFWRGSYQEVRRDMRGRYPKHKWPENPL